MSGNGAAGSMSTPNAKGRPGNRGSCLTAKVPSPKPTGDEELDDKTKGETDLLQEVMDGCLANRSLILHMHSAYRKRKEMLDNANATEADHAERLNSKVKDLASLCRESPEWALVYLVKKSDLAEGEIKLSQKKNPGTILHLLLFHLQLPQNFPLENRLRVRDVLIAWMDGRGVVAGGRLARAKQTYITIDADGHIIFTKASYTYEVKDGFYTKVTHVRTELPVDIAKYKPSTDYDLMEAWLDSKAHFFQDGMPPVKLVSFFKPKKGPKAMDALSPDGEVHDKNVETAYTDWQRRRAEARLGESTAEMDTIKLELDQAEKEEKAEGLAKARIGAKVAVAKKRKLNGVQYKAAV